jgi:predicted transporter
MDHFAKDPAQLIKRKKIAAMRKLKFLLPGILLLIPGLIMQAQDGQQAEMADVMRSNGRIYVVVAVVVLILIGLILYLVRLDKKITKMEKEK